MSTSDERWKMVGEEIRAAREARALTGYDVERISEGRIRQPRLSQIERAKRTFVPVEELEELEVLAEVLGMDLDTLALMAYGKTRPEPRSSFTRDSA